MTAERGFAEAGRYVFDEEAAAARLDSPDKDCEPVRPPVKPPLLGAAMLDRLRELGAARLRAGDNI